MIDTEIFLRWLEVMVKTSRNQKDDYFLGAAKSYQTIIELINMGVFTKK